MKGDVYKVRTSPIGFAEAVALSDEYEGHFLFENFKGELAVCHAKTGLMICDYNVITSKLGKCTYENWKQTVDYAIELTERNEANTKTYANACNHPCGVIDSVFAPDGRLKDVIERFTLPL